jgi:hypothetical protein
MGYYINEIDGKFIGQSFDEKCQGLLDNGATETTDSEFKENLVVVVDNGLFAGAGYAFSEKEFDIFRMPDTRRKKWFIVPNADILSGFKN